MKSATTESYWGGVVKSMGLVFGDIGTSPICILTVIFALTKTTFGKVMGILSLVFRTTSILCPHSQNRGRKEIRRALIVV